MRASVSASACTTSWMPSSRGVSDASVTMQAISTITSVSTTRPVISRSTHTKRSSTLETSALDCGTLGFGTRRTLSARGPRVDSRPMPAPAVVWRPDAELLRNSNVARFMAAEGIADFPELVARSIDEPEWFWDAVVRFLDIRFSKPYERVLDTSDGIPWAKWFVGGECNLASTCVDRYADDPSGATTSAVMWEGEEGDVRTLTWSELRTLTDRIASGLTRAWCAARRRGRPVPADVARDGRRAVRRGEARRGVPADLLRLRRRRGRGPSRRRGRGRADHRRRVHPPGQRSFR